MVEVTEADVAAAVKAIPEGEYDKKVQEAYPAAEEELVDFLNRLWIQRHSKHCITCMKTKFLYVMERRGELLAKRKKSFREGCLKKIDLTH
ncbi:hypothetical protein P8452_53020 [Trifolium repens]|nr:hypothetical protein P8452_53020 [Trifolium repens]